MKRYKAIFDLPDEITPPVSVGFQIAGPVQNGNFNPYNVMTITAPLIPVAYVATEEVDMTEKGENE